MKKLLRGKRIVFINIFMISIFVLGISICVQAVEPPTSLSYSVTSFSLWYGTSCKAKLPIVEGGTPTLYESDPPLPQGFAVDPETGVLGGKNTKPVEISGRQKYTITASNEAGSASCDIYVEVKPIVRFTADPLSIIEGEEATLSWRSQSIGSPVVFMDPGGELPGRSGNMVVSPEETTTYRLTVEAGGYTFPNITELTVRVGSEADLPIPVIEVTPDTTVEVGEAVLFDARKSTDNNPLGQQNSLANTYVWNYGDGSEVMNRDWDHRSGVVTMHYFMKPGVFPVTLTVNDQDGFQATTTVDITVTGEAPMEGFEVLHAPFRCRIAQTILVHLPDAVVADNANQLSAVLKGPDGDKILCNKNNLSSQEEFILDHRNLSSGDYVLEVKISDNNNQQLEGGLWRERFTKDYEGVPRVGIDENNALRVEGELHFPVYHWMINFAEIPDYMTIGAINGSFFLGGEYTLSERNSEGERVPDLESLRNSYRNVVEPNGLMGITEDRWFGKLARPIRNSDPDGIKKYTNTMKDSPSVLAWCWDDEPNIGGPAVPPNVLSAWHHITSLEDSHHPTLTNLAGYMFCSDTLGNQPEFSMKFSGNDLGKKVAIADIIHGALFALEAYKNYPDPEDPTRGAIDVYTDYLKYRREWNYDLLPTMAVSAPVKIVLTDPAYYGPPSPDEIRMMTWLNVVHGTKGMNWYPYYGSIPAENFATMGEFNQQVQELAPVILGPEVSDLSVADDANEKGNRVDTMLRETDEAYYLFTVRLTEREWWDDPSIEPEEINATFNITGLPETAEAIEYLNYKKVFEYHGPETSGKNFSFTLEQRAVPGTISIGGTYERNASGDWRNVNYIFDDGNGNLYSNRYYKDGGTYPAGSINYETGEITVWFPNMWGGQKQEIVAGEDNIVASYEPVREERKITIENGEFTDTFIRNGVHIYRIPKQFEDNMHQPVLETMAKQTIKVGVDNTFNISASDEDGGELNYSADFIPDGAEFNEDTQEFTWNPTEAQIGTYLVEFTVSDQAGLTDSMEVILDVFKPVSAVPTIDKQPLSQAVKVASDVTFSVTATGHPEPTYQWQYNGNIIEGATDAEVTLTNVTTDNAGQYTVLVSNEHGSITSNPADLVVVNSPTAISNLNCTVEYYTTYISWDNPEGMEENWDGILVIRKKGDDEPTGPEDGEEIYKHIGNHLTDRNLEDGQYYYTVYTYKETDINTVYSEGETVGVTIPDTFNKDYLRIDNQDEDSIAIGQNTRGDLYSIWNSPSNILGKGPTGNDTVLWIYSDIVGDGGSQIPAGSQIVSARLIFPVEEFSLTANINSENGASNPENDIDNTRSINIYRITDPDNLGRPHYAEESGIRVGLDYYYRDHRPGMNIPWQNDENARIKVLIEGVKAVDTVEFCPHVYQNGLAENIQFDITESIKSWINGEVNHGLYITADQGWKNGEQLILNGVNSDQEIDGDEGGIENEDENSHEGQNGNWSSQPYIEIIYADRVSNIDLTPPNAVSNLAIDYDTENHTEDNTDSDSIILKWTNPVDPDFAGVKILRKEGIVPFNEYDGKLINIMTGNSSTIPESYIDSGLETGKTYYYAVYTFDDQHNYSPKVWIKAIPGSPAAPTLDDPVAGAGRVSLSWNEVEGAERYHIYRKDNADSEDSTDSNDSTDSTKLIAEIDSNQDLSYTDYVYEGEYTYWVTAANQNGEGPISNKKIVEVSEGAVSEPQAPTALEAQALSGSEIELVWVDNSSNELVFVVERQNDNGHWNEISRTSYNVNHYNDKNLQVAKTYNYRVKAENAAGSSVYSNVLSVSTLDVPVAVTDISWEVISASQIKVKWEDKPNVDSYKVELFELSEDGEIGEGVALDTQIISGITYCYFVSLEPGKEYRVRVTTVKGENTAEAYSDIIRTSADAKGGLF